MVQVMRVASRSVRAGLWCTAGITAGIAVWLTASLAGMSALIAAHPGLLGLLQLFGGLFLAWMGTQSVRSGVRARRAPSHIVPQKTLQQHLLLTQKCPRMHFAWGYTPTCPTPRL